MASKCRARRRAQERNGGGKRGGKKGEELVCNGTGGALSREGGLWG